MTGSVGEISRKEFEDSIERKIDVQVPYDAKQFAQRRQARQAARRDRQVQQDRRTAGRTGPHDLERGATMAQRSPIVRAGDGKSLLGKIGDLKSLLPQAQGEVM